MIPLVPFMLMLSDMNRAHAREVEQLRLDDQCVASFADDWQSRFVAAARHWAKCIPDSLYGKGYL